MKIKFKVGDYVKLKNRKEKETGFIHQLMGDQVAVKMDYPEKWAPYAKDPSIKPTRVIVYTTTDDIEHFEIEKKDEWADLWDESAKKD